MNLVLGQETELVSNLFDSIMPNAQTESCPMYFDVDYNINFMLKLGPTDSMQLEFLDYDSI